LYPPLVFFGHPDVTFSPVSSCRSLPDPLGLIIADCIRSQAFLAGFVIFFFRDFISLETGTQFAIACFKAKLPPDARHSQKTGL
jgi:hypothetical protein